MLHINITKSSSAARSSDVSKDNSRPLNWITNAEMILFAKLLPRCLAVNFQKLFLTSDPELQWTVPIEFWKVLVMHKALRDPLKDFNLVQHSPWEDRLLGRRHSGTVHYICMGCNALAQRQKEDVPAIWKELLWFMVIFKSVHKVKIFHCDLWLCQWHLWFRTSWREMGCTGEVLHGV